MTEAMAFGTSCDLELGMDRNGRGKARGSEKETGDARCSAYIGPRAEHSRGSLMGGDDGALGSKARTWRACTSEGTRRSRVAEGVGDRNLGGGETVGVACAQAWRSGRVDT